MNFGHIYMCAIPDAQRGVKGRTSGEVARPKQIKIEAIVHITAIGRATSFSHQMLIAELFEMVRHEIHWLVEQAYELIDTMVAACKR
jgi:hypothetical protein